MFKHWTEHNYVLTFFQVGVIGNGTEYQHALKEDAHPKSNECMYKLREHCELRKGEDITQ